MEKPYSAYTGDDPYIFVCYAHSDDEIVYPEITWLRDQGINIWYDEGISAGKVWRAAVGDAIKNAYRVLFYVSSGSLGSTNCSHEMNFALDERKDIVPVYLEEIPLTTDLQVGLSLVHALRRNEDGRYQDHLLEALRFSEQRKRPAAVPPASRNKTPLYVAILVAVVLLMGIGQWYLYIDEADPGVQTTTLIISPFDSESNTDMGLEYEIKRRLQASPGLLVRVSESPFEGADYVLLGDVVGERLESQLVDGQGKSVQTWSLLLNDNLSVAAATLTRELLIQLERDPRVLARFDVDVPQQVFRDYLGATALIRRSHNVEATESAEKLFQQVIKVVPRYAPAHAGLCSTYLSLYLQSKVKANFQMAELHCNRALTLDAHDANVHIALGMLYRETGQSPKAIDSYNRALALAPYSSDAMRGLADTLARTGANVEAERWFREAITVEPNHWENYQSLGFHQFSGGEFEAALENFETAFTLAPDEIGILVNVGAAHFLSGNYDEAILNWRQVVKLQPEAIVFANLGASYFYQREFGSAMEMYLEAERQAPADFNYKGLIGEVLYINSPGEHTSYFESALRLALEHLDIDPNDYVTVATVAAYYAALDDKGNAYRFIKRALSGDSQDLDVLYSVAVSYIRLSDIELASNTLQDLISLGYTRKLLERDANFDSLEIAQLEALEEKPNQ